MNDINTKAILTAISVPIAGWLMAHLNFLGLDQATWNTLVFSLLSAGAATALGFLTRTTKILDAAGNLPGTQVVTTPALADALPANKDVVSSAEVKIVPKA